MNVTVVTFGWGYVEKNAVDMLVHFLRIHFITKFLVGS